MIKIMKVSENISNRVYHIVGFDNGGKIDFKLSLAELVTNGDHDSELLYTLQEDVDKILDLGVRENLICKSSRDDNEFNNIIVHRVS